MVILGIYYKLQTFLYLPASGIVQGMRPIIGYNYGAWNRRVRKIFSTTLVMCAAIMLLGTLLCLAGAEPLIALFTDNPETVVPGGQALRILRGVPGLHRVGGGLRCAGRAWQGGAVANHLFADAVCGGHDPGRLPAGRGPTGGVGRLWVTEAITALAAG